MPRINADTLNLEERVIKTNKVQKTHKGGRTMSWNALVVVGDGEGHVGIGLGKARGVPDAIRKGVEDAKKSITKVPFIGTTIPHEVLGKAGASLVLLKPAAPGTGVVAGGSARAILEVAGVRDVLAKSLGAPNAINTARATMDCLNKLKRVEEVAKLRGKSIEELLPKGMLAAMASTAPQPEPEAVVEAETVMPEPVVKAEVAAPEPVVKTEVAAPEPVVKAEVAAPEPVVKAEVAAPEPVVKTEVAAPEPVVEEEVRLRRTVEIVEGEESA